MLDRPRATVEHEQPRLVAAVEWTLRDELWRQLVLKLGRPHADIRSEH
jgi:hypothetical protein